MANVKNYLVASGDAMDKALANIRANIVTYNAVIATDKKSEIDKQKKLVNDLIKDFNWECRKQDYAKIADKENCLTELIRIGYHHNQVKMEKGAESKMFELVENQSGIVNILEFNDFYAMTHGGKTAGNNGMWMYKFEALAYKLALRVADELNIKFDERLGRVYKLTGEVEKVIDGVKVVDGGHNIGNREFLRTINDIVEDMVVMDGKVIMAEVRFLDRFCVRLANDRGDVAIPTRERMAKLMTIVLHKKMNNLAYEFDLEDVKAVK